MSPKYRCLPKASYSEKNYSLVSLRKQDIFLIMKWRNAQFAVLRQEYLLTDKDQESYYNKVIYPTYDQSFPQQILFSILHNHSCIGYGGLVHISWKDKRGEISFLVDNNRAKDQETYHRDFTNYLALIKHIAFKGLKWNRLFCETYDIRDKHIKIIEQSGFEREGRLKQHVIINGSKVDSLIHGMVKDDYCEREK